MPVHEYPGGICYYTWRVRHSNDGDDTRQGIMEYAIVRNNIYRLKISGIDRLGGEVPSRLPTPSPHRPTNRGPALNLTRVLIPVLILVPAPNPETTE